MSGDLVGSRISLISRKDIRWEGILVQVDRENASVTLQHGESPGGERSRCAAQAILETAAAVVCLVAFVRAEFR